MVASIVVAALAVASGNHATAPHEARYPGCRTRECDARVLRRKRRQAWARRHPWEHERNRMYRRQPWLRAALARLRGCETNGLPFPRNYRQDGHHKGAYQYDAGTWLETLGHLPARLRRMASRSANASHAPPAEQDVRTGRFWPSHRGRWACRA